MGGRAAAGEEAASRPRKYTKGPMAGEKHASGSYARGSRRGYNWRVDMRAEISVGGGRFCFVEKLANHDLRVLPADEI